jgi:Bacterial regulatory protein, Fis family/Recombinase
MREVSHVERLAYTRSQAAEALGISRSTLRRLLPYLETIELPWGSKLIPVDELERLAAERRTARSRRVSAAAGRKPNVSAEVVDRITTARAAGATYRSIAASLDSDRVPTAHGGKRWWPSTVRAVVERRLDVGPGPPKTGQLRPR